MRVMNIIDQDAIRTLLHERTERDLELHKNLNRTKIDSNRFLQFFSLYRLGNFHNEMYIAIL